MQEHFAAGLPAAARYQIRPARAPLK